MSEEKRELTPEELTAVRGGGTAETISAIEKSSAPSALKEQLIYYTKKYGLLGGKNLAIKLTSTDRYKKYVYIVDYF